MLVNLPNVPGGGIAEGCCRPNGDLDLRWLSKQFAKGGGS
jgi:hypothetical protein